jgi:hypothetical protein
MILKVHLQDAASYDVGHEIWHGSLADAIQAEAETIASYAGSDLLRSSIRLSGTLCAIELSER